MRILTLLLAFWLFSATVTGQTITTFYTASGTFTFTPPAGATNIRIACWGGGGGGGGTAALNTYGGGGGGGGYAEDVIVITPGTSYPVIVGAGGAAGSSAGGAGGVGGTTSFGANLVVATGGNGGLGGTSAAPYGSGGAGASTGMVGFHAKFNGGDGGNAVTTPASGGGGGSAGSFSNGNSANGNTPGAAVSLGAVGAAGRTTAGNGVAGNSRGGGASGGFRSSTVARTGGVGGTGRVQISFNCLPNIFLTSLPYSENFDGLGDAGGLGCLPVTDDNNDGRRWETYNQSSTSAPNAAVIRYNLNQAMNDWFFLPPFNLSAGTTYRLNFNYRGGNSGFGNIESLEVKYGTASGAAGMTTSIVNYPAIINATYNTSTTDFTPTTTGTHYIGFHGYSAANQDIIYVDDISVARVAPLPVAFLTFNARYQEAAGSVLLDWSTASELNAKEFIAERSTDGKVWTPVQRVAASGTTSRATSYQAVDAAPEPGTNLYRVKQVDLNGQFSYTDVVSVRGPRTSRMVTVAPVPATNTVRITCSDASLIGGTAVIYTMQGAEAYRTTLAADQTLDISGWVTGIYGLHLPNGEVIRIVKQ